MLFSPFFSLLKYSICRWRGGRSRYNSSTDGILICYIIVFVLVVTVPFKASWPDPGVIQEWTKGLRIFVTIPSVLLCEIIVHGIKPTQWQTITNKQPLSIEWCDVTDHVTRIKDLEYLMHNKQPQPLSTKSWLRYFVENHNSINSTILLKYF